MKTKLLSIPLIVFLSCLLFTACPPNYPMEFVDISDSVKISFNTESIKVNEEVPFSIDMDFTGAGFDYAILEIKTNHEWKTNLENSDGIFVTDTSLFLKHEDVELKTFSLPFKISFPTTASNEIDIYLEVYTPDAGIGPNGKKGIFSKKITFMVAEDSDE